jgi:hypothetical protein
VAFPRGGQTCSRVLLQPEQILSYQRRLQDTHLESVHRKGIIKEVSASAALTDAALRPPV